MPPPPAAGPGHRWTPVQSGGHIGEDEYNKAVEYVVAAQKEEHTAERTAARKLRDIKALP